MPLESSSHDEAETVSHFDGFIDDAVDAEKETAKAEIIEQILSREDFNKMFVGAFQMGSHFTQLKSLHVPDGDEGAKAASDVLYDTCLEIPALRHLLMPQNKWIERGFIILAFSVPIAINVKAEITAKRKASYDAYYDDEEPIASSSPVKSDEPDEAQRNALVGL